MNLNSNITLIKRVNPQELLFFTKHLAIMMKAGIPITEGLETLAEQTKSTYFKSVIFESLEDVKNGKSLAVAFKRHPKVFDEFYISLIDIAEESGSLDASLEFLAAQLAKNYSLKKKIQSALMYPMIVLTATALMGSFIGFYILPQLVDFFDSFEIDLPFTTKVLVVIANVMKAYGLPIFGTLAASVIVFYFLTKNNIVKPIWHTILLKLPLFGVLISYGQLARLARNLGTLIKSGVPVARSIQITANTLTNVRFRSDLNSIAASLTRGKNIGESMREGKFDTFPPILSRMVSIGEKTGKLDETLLYLGDFYEEEVDDISKNLSTILEPILLIVIGLVVGFVALSIISPIYQLTGSIRN